ncbi:MAG: RluA family pseudouridine synthase [Clostridia bacterium]|nr:RluA family pseudouridine synthase [Clostridia bacterium]
MEYEAFVDERIDKAVASVHTELSRSYIKQLIEDGNVTVSGKTVRPGYKIRKGDKVEVIIPPPKTLETVAQDIPLSIVYEDDSVLVINKPAGMVVHPAAGNYEDTLVNALLHHCGDSLSAIGGVMRPGIVHRIDKDTTGLLIVAKGDKAHQSLSGQLKTRTLSRKYFALVHGNVKEDTGTVDAPLGRDTRDRKKMAVTKGGREAVTHFTVLERFGQYTLVKCKLQTGRTHQIRVHMRHIGHPIVGDKTYGVKKEPFALSGQLLHAGEIGFIHPETETEMTFSAPLPEVFERVLDNLRNKNTFGG